VGYVGERRVVGCEGCIEIPNNVFSSVPFTSFRCREGSLGIERE